MAGDFNCVDEDDVRVPLDGSEPAVGSATLAIHFGAVFPSFCEIEQPDCTRRTQVRNVVSPVARLDRICANAPPARYSTGTPNLARSGSLTTLKRFPIASP